MESWTGRVALVTGATSGIGYSIALRLAANKMKVVATGRNAEKLEALVKEHEATTTGGEPIGSIVPMKCDLRNEAEILSIFDKIKTDLGGVDVCVNNAGVMHYDPLLSGETQKWKEMLDVNVIALSVCARESIKSMRDRGIDDGYIINLCSMSGHRLASGRTHFYSASKFAVNALSEGLRQELRAQKSRIRVTQISPGMVETDLFERAMGKDTSDKLLGAFEAMQPSDIADLVVFALSAPKRAEIKDFLIRPTAQPQ